MKKITLFVLVFCAMFPIKVLAFMSISTRMLTNSEGAVVFTQDLAASRAFIAARYAQVHPAPVSYLTKLKWGTRDYIRAIPYLPIEIEEQPKVFVISLVWIIAGLLIIFRRRLHRPAFFSP